MRLGVRAWWFRRPPASILVGGTDCKFPRARPFPRDARIQDKLHKTDVRRYGGGPRGRQDATRRSADGHRRRQIARRDRQASRSRHDHLPCRARRGFLREVYAVPALARPRIRDTLHTLCPTVLSPLRPSFVWLKAYT